MSTPSTTSDFLLLFRGSLWDKDLSEQEVQKVVTDWAAWFEGLIEAGKCKGGHPLEREGKLVSGTKGRVVSDGPFAESKEVIGGYFHLQVADMKEAVGIARLCPGLDYGIVVEVRPVAERCTDRARAYREASQSGDLAGATS